MTTEFENVPADTLDYLAKFVPVRPAPRRWRCARTASPKSPSCATTACPTAPSRHHTRSRHRRAAASSTRPSSRWPASATTARARPVANAEEALHAFHQFKGEPCVLEQMLSLDYEVSVVLARDENGRVAASPPSRTSTPTASSTSPSRRRAPPPASATPRMYAERIAERLGFIGTWRRILRQPRRAGGQRDGAAPHNSGHHTIDACVTSQYEQQVRALCGLPLGEARQHSASVMVNLLGELWYEGGEPRPLPRARLVAAARRARPALHLYAKHHARRAARWATSR
jgi:5-(carboxyamino)imidazole ribonucleotide synthase